MYDDKLMMVDFYCHVRHIPRIHCSVELEFHGDLQLMVKGFDVKVQGCVVRAYSCLIPQPGLVVYPWGNGTASSCPYEDGANVLVDAELIPFVRADFKNRINLWSVNSSGQLIRWE